MKKTVVTLMAAALMAVTITSCQHKYTAKMENMNDTLSYALGVAQSSGLLPFLSDTYAIDSTQLDNVIAGISDVAQASSEKQEAEQLGKSLGLQFKAHMFKALNYRFFGNDSTQFINESLFFDTFDKVAKGDSTGIMNAIEANYYVNTIAKRINIDSMEVTPAIADSLSMAYAVLNASTLVKSLNQDRQFEPASIKALLKSIQETAKITNSKDMAEVVGVSIGLQIKEQMFPMIEQEFFADSADFNRDNFFAAFFASMRGEDLLLDEMEAGAIMRREGEKIYESKMEANYGENKAAGLAFLEANKAVEGVKVTPSGLQYLVLKEGKGANPTATSVVKVHYHGTLIDGTVFDSSVNRGTPAEFPLNQVIAGWTEGLQLMNKGAKYRFFIPQELGYGGQDRGVIKPFSVLIFDVELLDIVK